MISLSPIKRACSCASEARSRACQNGEMPRSRRLDDPRLVREIRRRPDAEVSPDGWPVSVPAVSSVLESGLELRSGVTFVVDENGSGKSTLLEAVATPEAALSFSSTLDIDLDLVLSWPSYLNEPGRYLRQDLAL